MKRTKVLAAFGLFAIAAIMGIISLSSFTGKDKAPATKAIEKKMPEKKAFQTVTMYYVSGTTWSSQEQGAECGAQGNFCELTYDDSGVNPSRTPALIAADAQNAYATAGYLSDGLNTQTVSVPNGNGGSVIVTIFEKQ